MLGHVSFIVPGGWSNQCTMVCANPAAQFELLYAAVGVGFLANRKPGHFIVARITEAQRGSPSDKSLRTSTSLGGVLAKITQRCVVGHDGKKRRSLWSLWLGYEKPVKSVKSVTSQRSLWRLKYVTLFLPTPYFGPLFTTRAPFFIPPPHSVEFR